MFRSYTGVALITHILPYRSRSRLVMLMALAKHVSIFSRAVPILLVILACHIWPLSHTLAGDIRSLDSFQPTDLRLFLSLAKTSKTAYDDSQAGLKITPSGCVALVQEDQDGNLIIAFRGSMLGDRNPRHRFSNLGGANIRRNYRDWVATNLKQATGFLPRQYVEAAALVEEQVLKHPVDKRVFITGHSKGGGAATYAFVAVNLSSKVSKRQRGRVHCVTFNAAVVREQNWRRLYRRLDDKTDVSRKTVPALSILALCMRDDPVSKIAASEERPYVKRIYITPTIPRTPTEQHGIDVIIDELENVYDELPFQ